MSQSGLSLCILLLQKIKLWPTCILLSRVRHRLAKPWASVSSTLPFPWLSGLGGYREDGRRAEETAARSLSDSETQDLVSEKFHLENSLSFRSICAFITFWVSSYGTFLNHVCSLPFIQSSSIFSTSLSISFLFVSLCLCQLQTSSFTLSLHIFFCLYL